MLDPILSVQQLRLSRRSGDTLIPLVNDLSFEIEAGKTLALIGESGCGKSLTALSVGGLLPPTIARTGGQVRFVGRELGDSEAELRRLRGTELVTLEQEAGDGLDPVSTIGAQLRVVLRHAGSPWGRGALRRRAIDLLAQVGLPAPEDLVDAYPHQLSAGMRQRVLLSMALACEPKLLIADEPLAALDPITATQVLNLLTEMQVRKGTAMLLITRDLDLASRAANDVAVMLAGHLVEIGPATTVCRAPQHPYTQGLVAAVSPTSADETGKRRWPTLAGSPPTLPAPPRSCPFVERCPLPEQAPNRQLCRQRFPLLLEVQSDHRVRCHCRQEAPHD